MMLGNVCIVAVHHLKPNARKENNEMRQDYHDMGGISRQIEMKSNKVPHNESNKHNCCGEGRDCTAENET